MKPDFPEIMPDIINVKMPQGEAFTLSYVRNLT